LGLIVTIETQDREILDFVVGWIFVNVMDLNALSCRAADATCPVM